MAKIPYTKPTLTYAAQLQQLKDRGLIIEDDEKALHLLENISYFRFSGYWFPLLESPKTAHQFKAGATFDTAFKLYCFDRELRKLVLAELEKIEVAVRAKMIYILSHTHGPYWYDNPYLFTNRASHVRSVGKMEEESLKSDEDYIKSFRKKYTDPLPPCWMILEISSFGNLSHLYKNLRPTHDKRAIAAHFGLDDRSFESWLHAIVYIRNVCAHHSRLWNRLLGISPAIPLTPTSQFLTTTVRYNSIQGKDVLINNRAYYIVSMILYLLNRINPKHKFKDRFNALLAKYPNVDIKAMGATDNWKDEPLWKDEP